MESVAVSLHDGSIGICQGLYSTRAHNHNLIKRWENRFDEVHIKLYSHQVPGMAYILSLKSDRSVTSKAYDTAVAYFVLCVVKWSPKYQNTTGRKAKETLFRRRRRKLLDFKEREKDNNDQNDEPNMHSSVSYKVYPCCQKQNGSSQDTEQVLRNCCLLRSFK